MITKNAISVKNETIDVVLPDEKDRVFYEVVVKSNEIRESKLVTCNIKHFPTTYFVVTPKELCDIILKQLEEQND